MKTQILLFLFCLLSLNVMGQGTIERKKKQTTTQTSASKPKPKPAAQPKQKSSVKMCDICELPLSKCDYGGKHPYCQTCGKLKDRCEYKGNHPAQSSNRTAETSTTQAKTTSGMLNGHEWVDLGLSVKWATCNVGANSPSDYGGYYAWGETSTKSIYDWSNCFDCLDSTGNSWATYKLSGQTLITPSSGHDTARENWGSTWRMPTDYELKELYMNCKWTWTVKNGHGGYTITGKNGNSIFLPAAGWADGTHKDAVGSTGVYWSNTLSTSKRAYSLGMNCSDVNSRNTNARRAGQSVRPVTE